jgi:hypothetical protein
MNLLNLHTLTEKKKESLITALWVGSVFIILALVNYGNISANLWDGLVNFFTSLTLAPLPTTGISLPAPSDPTAYMNLYNAAFQFCLGIGALEIGILGLRVVMNSPVSRKAETIENIVFWLGTSFLVVTYLEKMTLVTEWFVFWAGVIFIFGLALLARAIVILASGNYFSFIFRVHHKPIICQNMFQESLATLTLVPLPLFHSTGISLILNPYLYARTIISVSQNQCVA